MSAEKQLESAQEVIKALSDTYDSHIPMISMEDCLNMFEFINDH